MPGPNKRIMLYQSLATFVAVIHFAFILFVVLGGLLVLRWPLLKWVHLPAAIWGALIEIGGLACPLTRIENALLRRAGAAGYDGGFIAHHLFGVIYPRGLTRGMEFAIAVFVIAVNAAIYRKVFH
ncbi:MAG: DUF2784 domain-containing protein [Acidobacteriota bacterium]|nr:DUF2784 domain-containing protein [Acidobacteriota bacterium]